MKFDVLIIGTGTAATTAATRCSKAGKNVAIVDDLPFGGTCALRGCDPKKVLRRGAEVVDAHLRLNKLGVSSGETVVQWPQLLSFKEKFTSPVPPHKEEQFQKMGVTAFHGKAAFVDKSTVRIDDTEIQADRIVVATGSIPRTLNIPGEQWLTSSAAFMEMKELPPRIVFVGGGYISFEFAHIAARLGVDVRILTRGERPLTAFDPDLVDRLVQRSRDAGIAIHFRTEVDEIQRSDNAFIVHASGDDSSQSFQADLVVHGAGRVPAVEGLGLDRAGVEFGKKGIAVNSFLQSVSNPAVYAAGDVSDTDGPPLTPVAAFEGKCVAENLIHGNNKAEADYIGVPSVVFTIPPLAKVGLLESEAQGRNIDFECKFSDMSRWFTAQRVGENCAAAKILTERWTGRILGSHILGPQAEETVNLFAFAIQHRMIADDIKNFVSAYPTAGSDIPYMV